MSKPPSKSGPGGNRRGPGRSDSGRSHFGQSRSGESRSGNSDSGRYGSGPRNSADRGRDQGEARRDGPAASGSSRSGPARSRSDAPRQDKPRQDGPRQDGPRDDSRQDRRRQDSARQDRAGFGQKGPGRAGPGGPSPRGRGAPATARTERPPVSQFRSTGKPPAAPQAPKDREGDRIAKLLARAGIASRREVERMIAEGRVKIGEDVVTTPATVLTSLAGVSVDGVAVKAAEPTRLFAFHKPAGLITAERDPAGRPTIYTALRNALPEGAGRVMPVGRLDFSTEGLLLLTNDGGFKRQLELPSTGVERTYRARAFGDVSQAQLEDLIEGIEIDGVRYGKIDANLERRTGRNQWVEMTLTEGKNREVRRVLEHLGLEVSRLLRVSYGPFHLGDLAKGQAVEIDPKRVAQFRESLGKPAA